MSRVLIILVAIVFFTCKKKEDPIIKVGNPIFSFSGEIGGESINYIAGEDNMYMYSSYEKDIENIYYFTGDFGDLDGNSKLKIGFRDYINRSNGESVDIENVIKVGKGFYKDSTLSNGDIYYKVNFKNKSYSGSTYIWEFGDGDVVTVTDTGEISHFYKLKSDYDVSLKVNNSSGCSSSLTKNIDLNSTCNTDFTYQFFSDSTGDHISLYGYPISGLGPYSFSFSIDSAIYNDSAASHYVSIQGIKKVILTQTGGDNCIAYATKNIDAKSIRSECISNFEYFEYEEVQSVNTSYFNTTYIEWADSKGVVYSTKHYDQEGENIKIISAVEYDNNEKGDKTRKVELEFNCTLYNSSGESKKLRNGKATIAVAYPN